MRVTLLLFLISFGLTTSAQDTLLVPNDNPVDRIVDLHDSLVGKLDSVDIQFQIRGFCYAYSSKSQAIRSNGEWHSSNVAMKLDTTIQGGAAYLYINQNELIPLTQKRLGNKLYLVNGSKKKIDFSAQDSRLNIALQALDEEGNWWSISYLPSSWCGNSYHEISLGKNEYWEFEVPVFKGSFHTKLRYVLSNSGGDKFFISNEIEGRINPEQFDPESKQGHSPSGIMDPYDD